MEKSDLESRISGIFRKSLFSDFVVEELNYSDNRNKGKEYADLLFIFGNVLIVFQAKTRIVKDESSIENGIEIKRIESRIEEAIGQIKSSLNQLRLNEIVRLRTVRGYMIDLEFTRLTKVICIVVIDAQSKSGASLVNKMEIINGFQEKYEVPIHIFKVSDLEVIVNELDTFPDLYEYLEIREKVMSMNKLAYYSGELDLLATYIFEREALDDAMSDEMTKLVIEPGKWEFLQQNSSDEEYRDYIRTSYCIDEIIDFLHASVGFRVRDEMSTDYEGSVEGYLKAAYELGRLNRVTRQRIAEILIGKARKAATEGYGYTFVVIEQIASSIVLLSFGGERAERRRLLYSLSASAYCALDIIAKGVTCNKVIGIATNPINCPTPSYDVLVVENINFGNADELRDQAFRYFDLGDRKV